MSHSDDHGSEMRGNRALGERETESVLRGQVPPGRPDLEPLARFVAAARAEAMVPPPAPSRELASLLTRGITGGPPRHAAGRARQPAPRPRPARTLAAATGRATGRTTGRATGRATVRAAGLGLAAKLAAVGVVTVTGVAGAGAAGVLPDPIQSTVADSVETITPFTIPRPDDPRTPGGDRTGEQVPDQVRRHGNDNGPESGGTGGNGTPAGKPGRDDKDHNDGRGPADPPGSDSAEGKDGKKDRPGDPRGGPPKTSRGKGHQTSPLPPPDPGR